MVEKVQHWTEKILSFENIAKMVILIFTTSALYFKLESRIAILEERTNQMIEIKQDIKEIKHDIKRIFVSGKIR